MNDKPKSSSLTAAILVFLLLVIIVIFAILVSKGCPPIPIPADQPLQPSAPPIGAPEVQPTKVEIDSSKPDLGVKGVSL